jgi:hypothetical protein
MSSACFAITDVELFILPTLVERSSNVVVDIVLITILHEVNHWR